MIGVGTQANDLDDQADRIQHVQQHDPRVVRVAVLDGAGLGETPLVPRRVPQLDAALEREDDEIDEQTDDRHARARVSRRRRRA